MKQLLPLTLFTIILFTSCQKEIEWPGYPNKDNDSTIIDTTTTPPTEGDLLVKVVEEQNGETLTTSYTYDNQKRLMTTTVDGSIAGQNLGLFTRYVRDATGRIVLIARKVADIAGVSLDTSYEVVHYPNATTFNYDYTITTIGAFGLESYDSSVYTFDNQNRLIQSISYISNSLDPSTITESNKYVNTYTAGNLSKVQQYADISHNGNYELVATENFEFDDKDNPATRDAQPFLIDRTEGASRNNIVSFEFINETYAPENFTVTTTIQYNSNNLPATAVSVQQPGNTQTNFTFYYQ